MQQDGDIFLCLQTPYPPHPHPPTLVMGSIGQNMDMLHIKLKRITNAIVLRRRDTKESTCLLRYITTEKSVLCQYAVCITRNTTLKK